MWIFGYGSLMFDGWEAEYGCTERLWADLAGYRRAFNKKSVENWGTPQSPGLTLNLTPGKDASCRGMAFAFNEGDCTEPMLAALKKREACGPTELPLQLEDGRTVTALVYIYAGKNLLGEDMTLAGKPPWFSRQRAKAAQAATMFAAHSTVWTKSACAIPQ